MPKGIEPSRLDKVFWPDEGLTKGDLIGYFRAVAPALLPCLRDRPLTVKRYPDGIRGGSFFQKNTPSYAPDWVKTVSLPAESGKRRVRYTLCNERRTLLWLANQACIELHPFLSRKDQLDRPDSLVFDIDPPEGQFHRAARVALLTREVLARHGLRGCTKTSGAKGIHIYVPLTRRYEYDRVREAAYRLATEVEEQEPGLVTTQVSKAQRGGRVFLDFTRVARGQHIVAPLSPRARPGATVSFPVDWDRLEKVDPGEFTIQTVPGILERKGDPWRALCPSRQSLPGDVTAA
jgi:DNA ligase D